MSQTIHGQKQKLCPGYCEVVLLFFADLVGINMAPGSATIPWDLEAVLRAQTPPFSAKCQQRGETLMDKVTFPTFKTRSQRTKH